MFRLLKEASECVPRSSKASLIVALDETCHQWKQIDESVLQATEASSWKEIVPFKIGLEIDEQIQRHHGHVLQLFGSFQQCLQCSAVEHQRSVKLSQYCASRSDVSVDLRQIPELERSFCEKKRQTVISKEHEIIINQHRVITLQIIDSRTSQIHQRIEMLESQSLLDLRKMLYCVHDAIKISSDADEDSIESSFFHIPIESSKFCKVIDESDTFIIGSEEYPYQQPSRAKPILTATSNIHEKSHPTTTQAVANNGSTKRRRTTLDASAAIRAKELLEQRQRLTAESATAVIAVQHEFREWDSVLLKDLNMDICQSFLFKHCQQCCSHTIQCLDIKSLAVGDEYYPKETFRFSFRRRRCQICDLDNARYIIFNDRLIENSPSLMCKLCYEMLHYDSSGNLLYNDFTVIPYIHDS